MSENEARVHLEIMSELNNIYLLWTRLVASQPKAQSYAIAHISEEKCTVGRKRIFVDGMYPSVGPNDFVHCKPRRWLGFGMQG